MVVKDGKALERRVAEAYRQMGARKVEHDVELAGHQIDVYVELDTPDRALHRIAVEAKDYTSPVGISILRDFSGVVDCLRRERLIDEGVIVSAAGFSRQARNAARKENIRLLDAADLDAMVAEAEAVRQAASARVPPSPPFALPPDLETFTGRERLLEQLDGLLRPGEETTVAIIGLCGMARILKRNQRKLPQVALDVDEYKNEPAAKVRAAWETSMEMLGLLLARIEATDRLIDQIVYRLYGLTEEEIAVVEGRS